MTWWNTVKKWASLKEWTPEWAPFFVKVWSYSDEELFPTVDPAYRPLVMDEIQNAAKHMAESYQPKVEKGLRYALIPFLFSVCGNLIYGLSSWVIGGLWNLTPFPALLDRYTPNFIKRIFNLGKTVMDWVFNTKVMRYFVIPEAISQQLHDRFLDQWYEKMRPLLIAFSRPFYEAILPELFDDLGKGDIDIHARQLVIDNKDSWYNSFMSVVMFVPSRIALIFRTSQPSKTFAENNAQYAYHLGQTAVKVSAKIKNYLKDVLWAAQQTLPTLRNGWTGEGGVSEAIEKTKVYHQKFIDILTETGAPLWEAFDNWGIPTTWEDLWGAIKSGIAKAEAFTGDVLALGTSEGSWWRKIAENIPRVVASVIGVIAAVSVAYAAALGVMAWFRGIRDAIYPAVITPVVNLFGWLRGANMPPPVPVPAALPNVRLAGQLQALVGQPVARHQNVWAANIPQADRQWLHQFYHVNGYGQQMDALLVQNGLSQQQAAIIRGLSVHP